MPFLFVATIFLSAFLLFQVQPLLGKIILPWFGGTPAVWTVCMLFFQAALLAGYGYAHGIALRLSPGRQRVVHLLLLAVTLAALPIEPDPGWKPPGPEDPTARILGLLFTTVGAPFVLLAATSPLLQSWYAGSIRGRSPYRLYAWSNVGSLLALLSYPVVIEPAFAVGAQTRSWSLAYAAFAGLTLLTALASARRDAPVAPRFLPLTRPSGGLSPMGRDEAGENEGHVVPTAAVRLLWLALAACGSTLFLAVTNEITLNIAAVPFLWVLPLSLYLLTFVLCFESDRWYRRTLFLRLLVVAVAAIIFKVTVNTRLWFPYEIALFLGSFFVCCMICHGELARLRPPPARLTGFYVVVAVGGALGGVFVGLIAPRVFATTVELPIALGGAVILALLAAAQDPTSPLHRVPRPRLAIGITAIAVFLGAVFASAPQWRSDGSRVAARNFWGTIRVNDLLPLGDMPPKRELVHGVITHGYQYLDDDWRRRGVAYYGPESGVGLAFRSLPENGGRRIGVIGLGVGTLAAFGRAGDVIRFYEINPLVVGLARREFTYLEDSAARIEIAVGDGRLLLEREADQRFDLLIVDVFSSDAIPVHILTVEALELYFRHLAPGGILALNLSNRYLDLASVAGGGAAALGRDAVVVRTPQREAEGYLAAEWMLVSTNGRLDDPAIHSAADPLEGPRRVWTDRYSDLFSILR